MSGAHFGLTGGQFARIAPHVPTDTRGKPRVDDRRVISAIIPVPGSGCRWTDAPDACGPHKRLYNRFVRWMAQGVFPGLFPSLAQAGGPPAALLIDSSAVRAHWSAAAGKGGRNTRPLGDLRAGRSARRHALGDAAGRPIAVLLTGAQSADLYRRTGADRPASTRRPAPRRHRRRRQRRPGAVRAPSGRRVPTAARRRTSRPRSIAVGKAASHPCLIEGAGAIGRMFDRLKDVQRIATRYDRLAAHVLAALQIVAVVAFWISVPALRAEDGPAPRALIAGSGYDADAILNGCAGRRATAVGPATINRRVQRPLERSADAPRTRIERVVSPINLMRRLATRPDHTA